MKIHGVNVGGPGAIHGVPVDRLAPKYIHGVRVDENAPRAIHGQEIDPNPQRVIKGVKVGDPRAEAERRQRDAKFALLEMYRDALLKQSKKGKK